MRRSAAALVLALLAGLGAFTPVSPVAAAGPKVVIIVGATHGATADYRAKADKAYAAARLYTSNVVKVYSPNATWSKVKAAAVGASIVIYFGHGNGWPSPYTYDPNYTTKDGFGLNATAGNGDYNNKYYGEPYVATLDLAPNAVVLLHHLCYASGNSEPGHAAPTLSVARKRVDNYAAGFLKSGAKAVIADGHSGPASYLKALFTTRQSIVQAWRDQPNFHGHESSFASSRTSGATAYMDPDTTSGGYYRSMVTKPGLTTQDVTGATYADTGSDPATLTVPGNAVVNEDGGGLFTDDALTPDGTGGAPQVLPAGARIRVMAAGTSLTAVSIGAVRVEGIDDPTLTGWMATGDLLPRDSTGPAIWDVDTGGGLVSPNGDERFDTMTLGARFSETVDWRLRIKDGETVLREVTGHGAEMAVAWDGTADGSATPLADGEYTYTIRAEDAWENEPATRTGTIRVDTVAAQLGGVSPAADVVPWISPNGDGDRETTAFTATTVEPGTLVVRVLDADGDRIRQWSANHAAGAVNVTWDGRDDAGSVAPDGLYELRIYPRDLAGTTGEPVSRSVRVAAALGFVTRTKALFYPQDGDRLAKATTLSFRLAKPATVTWTVQDSAGTVVRTFLDGQATAPGTYNRAFDGRRSDGRWLPTGTYTSVVRAVVDGVVVAQKVSFTMAAFAISASDSTPKRGQRITVKATSAESLSTRPRLYISQPGKATWSVAMTKTSTYGYKATITLKTGGGTGKVTFKVVAADKDGRKQRSSRAYPIH